VFNRRHRVRFGALALMLLGGVALMACHQVGSGQLHVANDLSGIPQDNTFLHAVVKDQGDAWPGANEVGILVQGNDIGQNPGYNMNGFVYLVRTTKACPMSEGAPETFKLADVTITGVITVNNGSVNQVVTMNDGAQNRASTWALIALGEMTGYPGEHYIYRCGAVTWNP